jgi:hypothetical protein
MLAIASRRCCAACGRSRRRRCARCARRGALRRRVAVPTLPSAFGGRGPLLAGFSGRRSRPRAAAARSAAARGAGAPAAQRRLAHPVHPLAGSRLPSPAGSRRKPSKAGARPSPWRHPRRRADGARPSAREWHARAALFPGRALARNGFPCGGAVRLRRFAAAAREAGRRGAARPAAQSWRMRARRLRALRQALCDPGMMSEFLGPSRGRGRRSGAMARYLWRSMFRMLCESYIWLDSCDGAAFVAGRVEAASGPDSRVEGLREMRMLLCAWCSWSARPCGRRVTAGAPQNSRAAHVLSPFPKRAIPSSWIPSRHTRGFLSLSD